MRRRIWVGAAVAVVALVLAALAGAAEDAQKASVVDPYAGCPLTPDIFGGVNYADTEPEPWLAANRARPGNLIGAFQQDRWDDGGAKGLVAAYTFDNGDGWRNVAQPFSKCALPYYNNTPCPPTPGVGSPVPCSLAYDRASDPWVDIGPDGRAYSVSISFNSNDNNNTVGASVSTDGGRTWRLTAELIHDVDADPQFPFNDKESVTADPTRAGFAYAVWDRLVVVNCGVARPSLDAPSADSRHWAAQTRGGAAAAALCFEGPTYFSRTTDGGHTWSTPVPIVTTLPDEQTISNQIVVDRQTGRLYDFYIYFPNHEPFTPEIRMVFSNDQGLTWSPQQFVNTNETVGIHDPDNPDQFARTGDIIPEPAIDPRTGQLYIVWQDGRFNQNGEDDVLISTSTAGGLTGTWSPPQRVNTVADRAGFTPAIKVDDQGRVAVDYYSLRSPQDGPQRWPVDRFIRIANGRGEHDDRGDSGDRSRSGGPLSFGDPIHIFGPFNMYMAPNAGGWFLGDYEGMAVDRGGTFHTFFAATNCNNTSCPSVGTPAPATGTVASTQPRRDPMDVYSVPVGGDENGDHNHDH